MKHGVYAGLLLGLVPIQSTILDYVSVGGIRPDLCLVAAVLVGLALGRFEGLLVGLALGLIQDFFSAGNLGLNLVTKGVCGMVAGITGRYVATLTPVTVGLLVFGLSSISGLVFLVSGRGGDTMMDAVYGISSVLLPQAVFDAALAGVVFALLATRIRKLQIADEGMAGLGS